MIVWGMSPPPLLLPPDTLVVGPPPPPDVGVVRSPSLSTYLPLVA